MQKPNLVVPPAFAPYKEEVKKMFTDSYGEYKYVFSVFLTYTSSDMCSGSMHGVTMTSTPLQTVRRIPLGHFVGLSIALAAGDGRNGWGEELVFPLKTGA